MESFVLLQQCHGLVRQKKSKPPCASDSPRYWVLYVLIAHSDKSRCYFWEAVFYFLPSPYPPANVPDHEPKVIIQNRVLVCMCSMIYYTTDNINTVLIQSVTVECSIPPSSSTSDPKGQFHAAIPGRCLFRPRPVRAHALPKKRRPPHPKTTHTHLVRST